MSEELFQVHLPGVQTQLDAAGASDPSGRGMSVGQRWTASRDGEPIGAGRAGAHPPSALRGGENQLTSRQAWELLGRDENARLIDVRTRAEWAYVGIPDLSSLGKGVVLCEWQSFPDMVINPTFCDDLDRQFVSRPDTVLLFICRSGQRSAKAAQAMVLRGYGNCINVSDGFEGDLSPDRRRSSVSGWKAARLPWVQT